MLISFEECIKQNGAPFKGVIHIGAHLGEEGASYAKNGVKDVLWIEANKTLMKRLYDNVKMLPGVHQDFENLVLSNVDNKPVTLKVTNDTQASSILPFGTLSNHYPHIKVAQTMELKTKRFDTFYREKIAFLNLTKYDFINIDVQGLELEVLEGFGDLFDKYDFKAIYTEVNNEPIYEGTKLLPELDAFLQTKGFRRVLTKITEYNWGDALYLRG